MALQGDKKRGQRGGGKPPVDSKTRAKIRKLAREGLSQTKVAAATGVSRATVAKVCAAANPPITFDRAKTAAAVQAHQVDLKGERAKIAEKAITEVHRLFGLLTAEHEVTHWDKDGEFHTATISGPTSGDLKNYATSIGILIDKHLVLVKADSDDRDLPAVEQWLLAMMGGAPQ